MKGLDELKSYAVKSQVAYRLVNSKFPPIALFDDVADAEEFDALYRVQALTNPRLQAEAGQPSLLSRDEIPFGITGCSYAVAPFTHVNPEGSRFSDGSYGVLYLADTIRTALAEVRYHQQRYWENIQNLKFDRFVLRGLRFEFSVARKDGLNATKLDLSHPIYSGKSYQASRRLGAEIRGRNSRVTLKYLSVRKPEAYCWALFSPANVESAKQSQHFEMVWDTQKISVLKLSGVANR